MDVKRKCVGCGVLKERCKLIKITKDYKTNEVLINPNSKKFGRSIYLCYNKSCIESALKKNRLQKNLKAHISEELKGLLIELK